MYDSIKAYEAQKRYCEENEVPLFAPQRCYRCKQDIFASIGHPVQILPRRRLMLNFEQTRPGISVEKASSELICGCPFCYASFDD